LIQFNSFFCAVSSFQRRQIANSVVAIDGLARGDRQVSMVAPRRLPLLPALLIAGNLLNQASAQEAKTPTGPRYPDGSNVTFEWNYSCANNRPCSFSCPGSGGASHVSKLTIYLGTVSVGTLKQVPALLYNFSTTELLPGDGFIFSAGLSTLSCQINGMTLDYSGPAKSSK
jgi:hypothetical protein